MTYEEAGLTLACVVQAFIRAPFLGYLRKAIQVLRCFKFAMEKKSEEGEGRETSLDTSAPENLPTPGPPADAKPDAKGETNEAKWAADVMNYDGYMGSSFANQATGLDAIWGK